MDKIEYERLRDAIADLYARDCAGSDAPETEVLRLEIFLGGITSRTMHDMVCATVARDLFLTDAKIAAGSSLRDVVAFSHWFNWKYSRESAQKAIQDFQRPVAA